MEGEAQDSFLAELRRLAQTVAVGGDEATVDSFVLCQFVDGLPEPTRSQLRALKGGSTWKLDATLECAKGMLLEQQVSAAGGGFLGNAAQGQDRVPREAGEHTQVCEDGRGVQVGSLKCYGCGGVGHMRSRCPLDGPRCFKCNQVGHIKRDCPTTIQGNGHRGSV